MLDYDQGYKSRLITSFLRSWSDLKRLKSGKYKESIDGADVIIPGILLDVLNANRDVSIDKIKLDGAVSARIINEKLRINIKNTLKILIFKIKKVFKKNIFVINFDNILQQNTRMSCELIDSINSGKIFNQSGKHIFGYAIKKYNANKEDEYIANEIINICKDLFANEYSSNKNQFINIFKPLVPVLIASARNLIIIAEKEIDIGAKHIVLPTLFSPFNRIIAIASRKHSINVITFDHGTGSGLWKNPLQACAELEMSNNYLTFSNYMKNALIKNYLMCNDLPPRTSIEVCQYKTNKYKTDEVQNNSLVRKIVYAVQWLGSEPNATRLIRPDSYKPFLFNNLGLLNKFDFETIYLREHPESRISLEVSDYEKYNVLNWWEHEVVDFNGIYILDYPHTSLLRDLIISKICIIFLEAGDNQWTDEAIQLIKNTPYFEFVKINNDDSQMQLFSKIEFAINNLFSKSKNKAMKKKSTDTVRDFYCDSTLP